jgi:hypothetical protein
MHEEPRKGFIEELQSLDEPVKRRVLVIAAIVAMFVVVYVWLGYFNNLVTAIPQEQVAQNTMQDQAVTPSAPPAPVPIAETMGSSAASGPSVWQRMSGGMAYMYGAAANVLRGFASIFGAPGQYTIKPQ